MDFFHRYMIFQILDFLPDNAISVRLTLIAFNPLIQKNVRLTLFCTFNPNLPREKILGLNAKF